jgi:hypothetical protein
LTKSFEQKEKEYRNVLEEHYDLIFGELERFAHEANRKPTNSSSDMNGPACEHVREMALSDHARMRCIGGKELTLARL